ncbi:MAG: hypothetical protein QOJ15_4021 [Bradyrhizobium sp.]|nr:hypothetical protein [Bradyrhizobium sp.]
MMDDQGRIRTADDSRTIVGRKDISDYTGSWGIPAFIGAVLLIAGVIIFTAAGPHRTRTAEYHNPNSKPASSQQPPTGEARGPAAKAPNAGMPTAPR